MCRWLVYVGTPIHPEDLLYGAEHSLIDQSQHAKMGATTVNGDGFGLGWYDAPDMGPGLFRDLEPAWSNRNLHELATHLRSGLFFAHVRAATGTAVQQTNCHPFRYGNWLWMHNGLIRQFHRLKRDLTLAVDPTLFPHIEGSSDSELMFYLALSLGLRDDPPGAVSRMVGHIEAVADRHGVPHAVQMTIATTDGEKVWGFRYSTERRSRSLFYSSGAAELRRLFPDNPVFAAASETTRLIVSEPLGDLPGLWSEVPESSYGIVQPGLDELHPFAPEPVRPSPGGGRRVDRR